MIFRSTGPMTCHLSFSQRTVMQRINSILSTVRYLVDLPRRLRGWRMDSALMPSIQLSFSIRLEIAYDSLAQRNLT